MKTLKYITVVLSCFFALSVAGQSHKAFEGSLYEKVSSEINESGEALYSCVCVIAIPDSIVVSRIKVVLSQKKNNRVRDNHRFYLSNKDFNKGYTFKRQSNFAIVKSILKGKSEKLKVSILIPQGSGHGVREIPVKLKKYVRSELTDE